jgi:hypothetical protein
VWGRGDAYRIVVGKPEGEKPFGKPRHRWDYYLKRISKK